jgi:hypothetical protein
MPKLVEHPGNRDLVLDRKIDARRLLAVAQGGVEQVDTLFTHHFIPKLSAAYTNPRTPFPGKNFATSKAWLQMARFRRQGPAMVSWPHPQLTQTTTATVTTTTSAPLPISP